MAEEVFENYTGHDIVVKRQDGSQTIFHSLGRAGIVAHYETVGSHNTIPLRSFDQIGYVISALPAPREGVRYIVSGNVMAANRSNKRQRLDLVTIDDRSIDCEKDKWGCVISVSGFFVQ